MSAKKLSLVVLVVLFVLSFSVHATEGKPEMSADMQAMIAKAKEASTPGAEHAVLKAFEGSWNVTSRSWMKPGDQPMESAGASTLTWTLDGRFLQQNFSGNWSGQPFEGIGFVGYDKMKKEYVSLWLDNMVTGVFQSKGQYDPATKTIKDSGIFSCPMTGETDKWFRAEWKVIDNNQHTYTMYIKDLSGKEFKSMELIYKRK